METYEDVLQLRVIPLAIGSLDQLERERIVRKLIVVERTTT